MKFDVYGRFQIEVRREANDWAVYRIALGKRTKINLPAPRDIETAQEMARYLDDLYHEAARPGESVSVIPD